MVKFYVVMAENQHGKDIRLGPIWNSYKEAQNYLREACQSYVETYSEFAPSKLVWITEATARFTPSKEYIGNGLWIKGKRSAATPI